MRALVIYDNTGRIWNIIYEADETPEGIQCMWVDIPKGANLIRIDVSKPEAPQPVFDYLPESEVGRLTAMVEEQAKEVSILRQNVSGYEKATMFAAFAFTDQQAVQVPALYPLWSDLPDGTILTTQEEAVKGTEITRVRGDDGKLYKVIKTHQKQADWAPGQATASLFTVIDVEHTGTLEDPIPAAVNMEYVKDKYYIEDGQIYLCIRDSETPLQYLPSQLVGQYFEIVEV